MAERLPRIAFAGDRDVAVHVLEVLLARGEQPLALVLPNEDAASHDAAMLQLCERAGISPFVVRARLLDSPATIDTLRKLRLDYIVCVHFPYMVRRPVLELAARGVLNLHPAYLPYNRGWHTPTWSILDGTPAGATLHFMSESLDAGDIVYQEQVAVDPSDTAHTLYLKLKTLEVAVFTEGWQRIVSGSLEPVPQPHERATAHRRRELFEPAVQKLELDAHICAGDLLRRLRALTTSRLDEAAYFERDGRRYRVQVTITPDGVA